MHYFLAILLVTSLPTFSRADDAAQDDTICLSDVESSEFMLHKTAESLQKWMGLEVSAKIKTLSATVAHLNQVVAKYEERESSFTILQSTVVALQAELVEYKQFVNEQTSFKGTIREELNAQNLIVKQHAIAIKDFKQSLSNINKCNTDCITDIKVSESEIQKLYEGQGYRDNATHGYFLTGLENPNKDAYADQVYRRKILMKKQNSWSPIHE